MASHANFTDGANLSQIPGKRRYRSQIEPRSQKRTIEFY